MRFGLLFPGQGSQSPGMGRALFERSDVARRVFEDADAALEDCISEVCFDGDEELLALTRNTQPAILTVSIATLAALRNAGLGEAAAAAGHSLGEYSAHVAAGTLAFADAVRTVRMRGRAMQEAVPVGVGAMAAILGLETPRVDQVCRDAAGDEVVSPANLNGPGQVVIAGHVDAVERAMALALERGARRAKRLPVSAPFHCSLMLPAAERLRTVLEEVPFHNPGVPVFTNVDARAVRDADGSRDALVRQVASPVLWIEVMEAMIAEDIRTFVEVGPGKVLTGLARRIDRSVRVLAASDPESVDAVVGELGGSR